MVRNINYCWLTMTFLFTPTVQSTVVPTYNAAALLRLKSGKSFAPIECFWLVSAIFNQQSFLLFMTKAGSDCCKLPLQTTRGKRRKDCEPSCCCCYTEVKAAVTTVLLVLNMNSFFLQRIKDQIISNERCV